MHRRRPRPPGRVLARPPTGANLSSKIPSTYALAVRLLGSYLEEAGMPTQANSITREHLESFLVALGERTSATTARSLQGSGESDAALMTMDLRLHGR